MENGNLLHDFQPTMLGSIVRFEEGLPGMITDESRTDIFIESDVFTGWMSKAEFWEALGIEE
jgi:hypothetical protein